MALFIRVHTMANDISIQHIFAGRIRALSVCSYPRVPLADVTAAHLTVHITAHILYIKQNNALRYMGRLIERRVYTGKLHTIYCLGFPGM